MKEGQDRLDIKCTECVVIIRKELFCSFFVIHKSDKSNFERYPMTSENVAARKSRSVFSNGKYNAPLTAKDKPSMDEDPNQLPRRTAGDYVHGIAKTCHIHRERGVGAERAWITRVVEFR